MDIFPTTVRLWGRPHEMLLCVGLMLSPEGNRVTLVSFFA